MVVGRAAIRILLTWVSLLGWPAVACGQDLPWKRYAIDDSLRGADGVRLADANGDGRPDIVTGWEESGVTRAYLHPGREACTRAWPSVTVGNAPAVEDAVWVDMTGDGRLDVLSSCEGKEQSLRLHIAPGQDQILDEQAWRTHVLPDSQAITRWMFALPFSSADKSMPTLSTEIVVGSKAPSGMLGMLRRSNGATSSEWSVQRLSDAQWIMSIDSLDIDHDADQDIVYSDRKGNQSGVYWLENPSGDAPWNKHLIGALGEEVMFLQVVPSELRRGATAPGSKPKQELVVAVKPCQVLWLIEGEDCRKPWASEVIQVEPSERIGHAKAVAIGDLTGDGRAELVFSCEGAEGRKQGVVYLTGPNPLGQWQMHDVSGPAGIKYDRIELVDIDLDQDLDVLTCEEREAGRGLGVIWYANPAR